MRELLSSLLHYCVHKGLWRKQLCAPDLPHAPFSSFFFPVSLIVYLRLSHTFTFLCEFAENFHIDWTTQRIDTGDRNIKLSPRLEWTVKFSLGSDSLTVQPTGMRDIRGRDKIRGRDDCFIMGTPHTPISAGWIADESGPWYMYVGGVITYHWRRWMFRICDTVKSSIHVLDEGLREFLRVDTRWRWWCGFRVFLNVRRWNRLWSWAWWIHHSVHAKNLFH